LAFHLSAASKIYPTSRAIAHLNDDVFRLVIKSKYAVPRFPGVDLTTVKELLGHKTLAMTLRYSHLAPSHKVKAVDLLDSKLNEVCEKEVSCV
jgi:integrase